MFPFASPVVVVDYKPPRAPYTLKTFVWDAFWTFATCGWWLLYAIPRELTNKRGKR